MNNNNNNKAKANGQKPRPRTSIVRPRNPNQVESRLLQRLASLELNQNRARILQGPRVQRKPPATSQLGAVVRSNPTKTGMSDIKGHRARWTLGYVYVGNGTDGATNSVYFVTNNSTYKAAGYVAGSITGLVPILGSDTNLGASYISDIEKHYARKVIRRMWLHIDSLHPSTSNDMMCVIAPRRGGASTLVGDFVNRAANTAAANDISNLLSMKGAFTVNSWESKSVEISEFIAGGSGAQQNEFEIGSLSAQSTVVAHAIDNDGVAPACIAVSGNNSTAGLQSTNVHQIVVEQEIDLLDYVGGMAQPLPSQ